MYIFPDYEQIRVQIINSKAFEFDNYEVFGLDQIISEIAANRFKNRQCQEFSIKVGIDLIVKDLKQGKDCFTNQTINQVDLNERKWRRISTVLEILLKSCATIQSQSSDHQSRQVRGQ